ncbi:MAG TPA: hypothetical protein VF407_19575, partial [Polyangiaceae bacterium]
EGARTTNDSVMQRNPTLPRQQLVGEPKRLQMPSQSQAIRRRSSTSITQSRQSNVDNEELEGQARGLAQRFGKAGSRA